MKYLVNINRMLVILTLVLFITIYFGFMAEIILGLFQLLCSVFIIRIWNKLKKEHKKHLKIYWTLTIVFGLGFLVNWGRLSDHFLPFIFGLAIIPMSLAVYFTRILEKIQKQIS